MKKIGVTKSLFAVFSVADKTNAIIIMPARRGRRTHWTRRSRNQRRSAAPAAPTAPTPARTTSRQRRGRRATTTRTRTPTLPPPPAATSSRAARAARRNAQRDAEEAALQAGGSALEISNALDSVVNLSIQSISNVPPRNIHPELVSRERRSARGPVAAEVHRFDDIRNSRSPASLVVEAFRNLRRNYAIVSARGGGPGTLQLEGYTLREIVQLATEAGCNLSSLYLSGQAFTIQQSSIVATSENYDKYNDLFYMTGYRKNTVILQEIISVPLSAVVITDEIGEGSGPAWDPRATLLANLRERSINSGLGGNSGDALGDYICLLANIRVERRSPFPAARIVDVYRTGGFDRLILYDAQDRIQLPAEVSETETFLYVPGTVERLRHNLVNCVFQCISWSIFRQMVRDKFPDNPYRHCDVCFLAAIEKTQTIYKTFQKQWMETKVNVPPLSHEDNAKYQRLLRKWSAVVRHGFSQHMLRKLTEHMDRVYQIDFRIYMWSAEKNCFYPAKSSIDLPPAQLSIPGTGVFHLNHDYIANPTPYPTSYRSAVPRRDTRMVITAFQMNLDGEIQKCHRTVECEKEIFPGLLHAVAIDPPISERSLVLTDLSIQKDMLDVFEESLRRITAPHFAINAKFSLSLAASPSLFMETVRTQQTRMLKDQRFGFNPSSESSQERQSGVDPEVMIEGVATDARHPYTPNREQIGVVVYDLETVENLRGIQDKVHPCIRTLTDGLAGLPDELRDIYHTPQSQIPYSVQWAFVNMDFNPHAPSSDAVPIEAILTRHSVEIEFGGPENFLGGCVEDFLDHAAVQAATMNLRTVYCYAHNGCGFDAYLILRNLYKPTTLIKKVLVTPRGLLSLTISVCVSIHEGGNASSASAKTIDFIFRDTKVFFAARLADLCKIFKVPSRFCKTDFPITKIHARNYDDPVIRSAYREYLENDIWSLAFVVNGINSIIETEVLKSSVEDRSKPDRKYGICRFVTLMSLVTHIQERLFSSTLRLPQPAPIEIPALRNYVSYANMGGRVLPFWRSFRNKEAPALLESLLREWSGVSDRNTEKNVRALLHTQMIRDDSFAVVLDVTSLYPYAMSHYPMPVGAVYHIPNAGQFFVDVVVPTLGCMACFRRFSLCDVHSPGGVHDLNSSLGFSIFIVKDLKPPSSCELFNSLSLDNLLGFKNICARKTVKGAAGLIYNFMTADELVSKFGEANDVPRDFSSFTMYDLFWMDYCGWTFEVVDAFGFASSYAFRKQILNMFERRKAAKTRESEEGLPKSLSTMWKNLYNGMYGINARKDIVRQYLVVPDGADENELRRRCKVWPDEYIVRDSSTHQLRNGQWMLKIEKFKNCAEYFASQSPNHIGAAVTSAARHHVNLLLSQLDTTEYGYTDTDSLFVKGSVLKQIRQRNPTLLDERPDADMGSYKNDHEGPGNNVVFMSFLLAKKVKLHLTVNSMGDVLFHDTFKGFNPSPIHPVTGDVVSSAVLDYQKVKALGEIFFTGTLSERVSQTEWRRNLADGVVIDKDCEFSCHESTYFGHSASSVVVVSVEDETICEVLIPHGWKTPASLDCAAFQASSVRFLADGRSARVYHVHSEESLYNTWSELMKIWPTLIYQTELMERNNTEEGRNADKWDALFRNSPKVLTEADFAW